MDPVVEYLMRRLGKTEKEAKELWKKYQSEPWAAKVVENLKKETAAQQEADFKNLTGLYDTLGMKDPQASLNQRIGAAQRPQTGLPAMTRMAGPTLQGLAYPPAPIQAVPSVSNFANFGNARPVPSRIPLYGGTTATGGSDIADLGGQ